MKPLALFLLAGVAFGQDAFHGSFDVGYRGRSGLNGSRDAYRNVVNLGEGVRLLGFSGSGSHRLADRYAFDASGWGGDPDTLGSFRAEKDGVYRFTARYRNLAYFNRLPSFALGVESRDVRRRASDVELTLFTGKAWTPYLNWSADGGSGRSVNHFSVDANEYAVAGSLNDRTDFFRAGVHGRIRGWTLTLEQGGSIYRQDDSESTRDRNLGNRSTLFAGQRLTLDSLDRYWRIRGDALSSRASVAGSPASWIDISGSFLFTQPETESAYAEDARGTFIDQASFRFSNRISQFIPVDAKMPHRSGTVSVEIRPVERVRILETWWTDRFESASPLSASLAGAWSQQQLEGLVDLGRGVTARGGWRRLWGDALTRTPLVGGPGAASVSSNAGLLGFTVRPVPRFDASADYEGTVGGRVLYAVGIQDAHRLRTRARATLRTDLILTAASAWLDGRNGAGRQEAKLTSRSSSATLTWAPSKGPWSVSTSYARSSIRSDTPFLIPNLLSPGRSLYREDAHSWSSLVEHRSRWASIGGGGSAFRSSGSRPSQYWQPEAHVATPVRNGMSLHAEWRWYGLAEPFYAFEDFRTHVWQAGFRMVR